MSLDNVNRYLRDRGLPTSGKTRLYYEDTKEYWWEREERLEREEKEREEGRLAKAFERARFDALPDEEQDLEQARKDEATLRQQAQVVGVDVDEAAPGGALGALNKIGRTLDAGRAGLFAGFEELGSALTPGGDGASLDNFLENFDNRKGAGDIELLKMRDDDAVWQRALKGAGALVGDIALDPLTYVTFGAGAMGRQAASRAGEAGTRQAAKAAAGKLSEAGLRRASQGAADEVAAIGARLGMGSRDEVIAKFADDPNTVLDELSEVVGDAVLDGLDTTRVTGPQAEKAVAAAKRQMFERVGREGLANGVLESYSLRGGRGVRAYLGSLDEKAMDLVYDALPGDLRGGLRMATPIGSEKLRRGVRLFDGTNLSESLDVMTGGAFGKVLDAGSTARRGVNNAIVNRDLAKFSGQAGAAYREVIAGGAARSEDVTGLGWGRWSKSRKIAEQAGIDTRALDVRVQNHIHNTFDLFAKVPKEQQGTAEAAMKTAWLTPRLMDEGNELELAQRLGKAQLEPWDTYGVQMARELHEAIRTVGREAKGIYGDKMGWVDDFVPRMGTEVERVYRDMTRQRKGGGRFGKTYDPKKARKAYTQAWKLDPDTGELHPKEWMNPASINKMEGREVFQDDPFTATLAYVTAVSSTLKQERIIKALDNAGLIIRPSVATKQVFSQNNVGPQVARALEGVRDQRVDVARKTSNPDELANALRRAGLSEETLGSVASKAGEKKARLRFDPKGNKAKPWVLEGGGRNKRFAESELSDAKREVAERGVKMQREDALQRLEAERAGVLDGLMKDENTLLKALDGTLWEDPEQARVLMDSVLDAAEGRVHLLEEHFNTTVNVEHYQAWFKDSEQFAQLDPAVKGSHLFEERLSGLFAAPEVARLVKDTAELRKSLGGDFRKDVMDPYMRFFKTWATIGRGPGFVARNVMGGMLNAYLVGARAQHFAKAGQATMRWLVAEKQIARQMRDEAVQGGYKGPRHKAPINAAALEMRTRELFREKLPAKLADEWDLFQQHGLDGGRAWQNALAQSGFSDDFSRSLQRGHVPTPAEMSARSKLGGKLVDNTWTRANGALAAHSETYLRFGSFLAGLERFGKQDGGFAAALNVKASQFDYDLDSMTLAERKWARMVLPFYTFARWNAPLNARAIFTDPGKIMGQFRAFEQTQRVLGSDGNPDDDLPVWMRELGGDRVGFSMSDIPLFGNIGGLNNDDDALVLSMSGLPIADLARFLPSGEGNVLEEVAGALFGGQALSAASPLIKAPIEGAVGKQLFTGADLKDRTSPFYEWPAEVIEKVSLGLIDMHDVQDGEEFMEAGWANAFHNLLPTLGLADRLIAPGDDPRHDRRTGSSWLSTVTGVGFATADPNQLTGASYGRQNDIDREARRKVPNFAQLQPIIRQLIQDEGYTPEQVQQVLDRLGPLEFAARFSGRR